MKPLNFVGSSLDDLRAFPTAVRHAIGVELMRVQLEGAWRVIYVAKFEKAIYVLHAFRKKTQRTAQSDIELAVRRYKLIGGLR